MAKKYKIDRENEDLNVSLEDICLDGVKEKPDVDVSYFKLSKSIYIVLTVFLVCITGILIWRSYNLQVVQGEELSSEADQNTTKLKKVVSPRGIIYDSKEVPLVENAPSFDVAIIPSYFNRLNEDNRNDMVERLGVLLDISEDELRSKIEGKLYYSTYPVLLKKDISHDQAVDLKVQAYEMPGVEIITTSIREYIQSPQMSHILGYIGKVDQEDIEEHPDYLLTDNIGKLGIEEGYESELRGDYGEIVFEIDSKGNEKREVSNNSPIPGDDLILTIDSSLQRYGYELLDTTIQNEKQRFIEEHVEEKGPEAGSIIVMDANTGGLISLVSFPSYNNNVFSPKAESDEALKEEKMSILTNEETQPMFFRAITGKYASGSVIKPLVGLAALEEGIITRYTKLDDYGGKIVVGDNDNVYRDSHLHPALSLNIVDAISESSNVFFYQMAGGLDEEEYKKFKGMGAAKLSEYYHKYGLGQVTGIDIAGEAKGLIPDPLWKKEHKNESWYLGDTYNISIGQGDLLVTPLQVATYTALIANGGTLYEPHLVREIRPYDEEPIDFDKKVFSEELASGENVGYIQEGMRKAAKEGTGRSFASLPLDIHSKTGTAQSPGGETSKPHSWVTSYATINDTPVVVTVMIENGGYGSEVAIPVAKQIYQWLIDNYKI